MAFLLSIPQMTGHPVANGQWVVFIYENQNDSQDSENGTSLFDDDDELEFIATNGLSLFAVDDQSETITTDAIGVKSQFYFCMWRPPRV